MRSHTLLRLSSLTKCKYLYSDIISKFWTARRPIHLALGAPILECSFANASNAALLQKLPLRFTTLRPSLWTARRPAYFALDAPILECSSAIAPNAANIAFKCQTCWVCRCRVARRLQLRLPVASSLSSLEELYQESDARSSVSRPLSTPFPICNCANERDYCWWPPRWLETTTNSVSSSSRQGQWYCADHRHQEGTEGYTTTLGNKKWGLYLVINL